MDEYYQYLKSVEKYLYLKMLKDPEDQELFNQWTLINQQLDAELRKLLSSQSLVS